VKRHLSAVKTLFSGVNILEANTVNINSAVMFVKGYLWCFFFAGKQQQQQQQQPASFRSYCFFPLPASNGKERTMCEKRRRGGHATAITFTLIRVAYK